MMSQSSRVFAATTRWGRAFIAASAVMLGSATMALAQDNITPSFTLRDANNKDYSVLVKDGQLMVGAKGSEEAKQVVLVSFWATWCGPCKLEMPHVDAMDKELADQGFEGISISIDDSRAYSQARAYVKGRKFQFNALFDKESKVVAMFNPSKTLPYTVIIDKAGKIRHVHTGYNPGDEVKLKKEIQAILDEG
jgi:thiol-disulfide isomerase/thioredoxin